MDTSKTVEMDLSKSVDKLHELTEVDFCEHYGEPGYEQPETGIYFANWNEVPEQIQQDLECAGNALEWYDEWYVDHDHNKAWRIEPSGAFWECQTVYTESGILTPDDDICDWIESLAVECKGQPIRALPSWMGSDDIEAEGFVLHESGYESGLHEGMNAVPEDIAATLLAQGFESVLFQIEEQNMFAVTFKVWVKK